MNVTLMYASQVSHVVHSLKMVNIVEIVELLLILSKFLLSVVERFLFFALPRVM